jgi:hypothetical protein
MLRNTIFAAAIIALTPALAIAAPTTVKPAHTAIAQSVKAENVSLTRHHKAKHAHKIRMARHHKAKSETVKS